MGAFVKDLLVHPKIQFTVFKFIVYDEMQSCSVVHNAIVPIPEFRPVLRAARSRMEKTRKSRVGSLSDFNSCVLIGRISILISGLQMQWPYTTITPT